MRFSTAAGVVVLGAGCLDYDPIGEVQDLEPVFNPAEPPTVSQTDSYSQIQLPEVDILWVVDNSCSMGNEQDELAENFPVFMEFFLGSGLDYHIGVTSTDVTDGPNSGRLVMGAGALWITPETPNPVDVFTSMAVMGTSGFPPESGIATAYAALELQPEHNAGFLRDTAALHIITVSDEPDYSGVDPISLPEFVDYLNDFKPLPDEVTYNAIVMPDPIGTRYIDVVDQVGGVYWSLEAENWVGALEAIGLATAGLRKEYFLTELPVEDTIRVTVVSYGYEQGFTEFLPESGLGDWVYSAERNSVAFLTYVPDPGAEVRITYDVLSSAERQ
jgi:hypothetical protein